MEMTTPSPGSLTAASSVLERDVLAAVDGRGIRTAFQPIVDVARHEVVGYEALARIGGDDGHPPDLCFEIAREQGSGPELQAATLRDALSHRSELPQRCFLALNVDPELLGSAPVREAFEAAGDLGGLVVEITEHRPWQWSDLAPAIHSLRSQGARIAVADPGTGYPGLRQLLSLRPSFLKLGRTLVQAVDSDEAKTALVEMLMVFAERLDARVIAVGVETVGEAARLAQLGVPLAQGYFFGHPAEPWAELDPARRFTSP